MIRSEGVWITSDWYSTNHLIDGVGCVDAITISIDFDIERLLITIWCVNKTVL